MIEALEDVNLVVYQLVLSLDALLEDDLDGDGQAVLGCPGCLLDLAECPSTEGPAECEFLLLLVRLGLEERLP